MMMLMLMLMSVVHLKSSSAPYTSGKSLYLCCHPCDTPFLGLGGQASRGTESLYSKV